MPDRPFRADTSLDPARVLGTVAAAADQLGLGVFVCRVDLTPPVIRFLSRRAGELLGHDPDALIGRSPLSLFPPDEALRLAELMATRAVDAPPIAIEVEASHADGRRLALEVGLARVAVDGELWTVGYFRDLSGRRAAELALRASEERFRSLVEKAPDGVVILRGATIAFMNAEASRLLGLASREAGIGQTITALLPPEEAARARDRIGEMMRTGIEHTPTEYRVVVDGIERRVEIKSILAEYEGAPAVIAFARDATERRLLEQEMLRADRLAAIGTLAAAVAHEINNPLTYTQLSLQYVERELAGLGLPEERLRGLVEHVRNARHGAERVATIVRDLRAFSRSDDDTPPGPVDLVAVVERAIKIAENDLRHRARLVRRYAPELPAVTGNASRLEQVFLNLLINAVQALSDGDPARDEIAVTIAVRGDRVEAVVADSGPGIPEELRGRVFDAFFTTKPVGVGTGLGLAVCRTILDGMGGTIDLERAEGRGTRVRVGLPAHRGAAREPTPPPPAVVPDRRLRVLVVDDEPLVRRVMMLALERHHDVEVVDGGPAALEALAARPPDVVLCDLMMPGMSGMDLHAIVVRERPALARRFVFVTGGAFVPRLAEFLDQIDNPKLLKPFDAAQVLNVVQVAAGR